MFTIQIKGEAVVGVLSFGRLGECNYCQEEPRCNVGPSHSADSVHLLDQKGKTTCILSETKK